MTTHRGLLWLSLALLAPAGASRAQDAALCSDRPGKATPACVLEAGGVQIETSLADWSRERSEGERTDTLLLADSLMKFGLGGDTELQVSFTPYQQERITGDAGRMTDRGIGDAGLAVRHLLVDGGGEAPSFALQPFVTLPVGAAAVSDGTWSAGLIAPLDLPLGGEWQFNISPQLAAQADEDGDGRHLLYGGTAELQRSLGRTLTASAELFAERDDDPLEPTTAVTADATLAWQPSPSTQIDVASYVGLSHDAPAIQLILGFTRRLQ
ncbi:transporter [Croceibacterium sp. TMG7-5b_MA50]|uniref:transporter n=1 Tax=Croceibacterium sp. TMG7-5b_MA50 TaxID=3121290 RepID=UPI0032215D3A